MTAAETPAPGGTPPLFSVVIPTYNRAELLKETLDSVLTQRLTDFEVKIGRAHV